MKASELTYVHRYLPPNGDDPRTLLLLHGTGGDENDLVHLGQMLAPDAGLLSPRGNVLENGAVATRFYNRTDNRYMHMGLIEEHKRRLTVKDVTGEY